jgi:hypothetical protein
MDSQNTRITGTVDLTDSENIKFKSFRITQASITPTIVFDKVAPVAPVVNCGRHFFQECVIDNGSAGEDVVEFRPSVTDGVQFRECTLVGHIDLQSLSTFGSYFSLLKCQAFDTTIEVNFGYVFSGVDCYSMGSIVHNNGLVYLRNIPSIARDGSNRCILSTASLNPGRYVYLENISTHDFFNGTWGSIEIQNCAYAINGCTRDPSVDNITGLRFSTGHRAQDMAYDNTDSGIASTDVKSAIDELALLETSISDLEASAAGTKININQNQPTEEDLTDIIFDLNVTRSASIEYSIYRRDQAAGTFESVSMGRLFIARPYLTWNVSDTVDVTFGNSSGVTFSIDTATGQVRYTSTDVPTAEYEGYVVMKVKRFTN